MNYVYMIIIAPHPQLGFRHNNVTVNNTGWDTGCKCMYVLCYCGYDGVQYLHDVDVVEIAEVRVGVCGVQLHGRSVAVIWLDDGAAGAFLGLQGLHRRRPAVAAGRAVPRTVQDFEVLGVVQQSICGDYLGLRVRRPRPC